MIAEGERISASMLMNATRAWFSTPPDSQKPGFTSTPGGGVGCDRYAAIFPRHSDSSFGNHYETMDAPELLSPFEAETDELQVIIDTPKGSRNKFSWDEKKKVFKLTG